MGEHRVLGKVVISIVDDDASVREGVADLVGTLGYDAHSFRSAQEFLGSDRLGTTDCLIIDMQMPKMTGIELHERLIGAGFVIPTVLITAYPDETTRRWATEAGMVGYLVKPCAEEALFDCISSALKTTNQPGRPASTASVEPVCEILVQKLLSSPEDERRHSVRGSKGTSDYD